MLLRRRRHPRGTLVTRGFEQPPARVHRRLGLASSLSKACGDLSVPLLFRRHTCCCWVHDHPPEELTPIAREIEKFRLVPTACALWNNRDLVERGFSSSFGDEAACQRCRQLGRRLSVQQALHPRPSRILSPNLLREESRLLYRPKSLGGWDPTASPTGGRGAKLAD